MVESSAQYLVFTRDEVRCGGLCCWPCNRLNNMICLRYGRLTANVTGTGWLLYTTANLIDVIDR